MKACLLRSVAVVVTLSTALGLGRAVRADWPMWRGDANRSASTDEQLPAKLSLTWSRQLPALKPAWPEDSRLQFDAHYEPVVMGSTLFVSSSRSDSLTAIDTSTGAERWKFYAEGPVRLAPIATQGKVYFGSDDGFAYCLSVEDGFPCPGQRKTLGRGASLASAILLSALYITALADVGRFGFDSRQLQDLHWHGDDMSQVWHRCATAPTAAATGTDLFSPPPTCMHVFL